MNGFVTPSDSSLTSVRGPAGSSPDPTTHDGGSGPDTRLATSDSTIEPAGRAVAGDDSRVVGADTIGHGVAAAIEAEVAALQRCAVAAVAVGAQQRLNVACVVDSLRRLGGRSTRQPDGDSGEQHEAYSGECNSHLGKL